MNLIVKEDCKGIGYENAYCWSVPRPIVYDLPKGTMLIGVTVERGKKKKGGRTLRVYIDSAIISGNYFDIPEKYVEEVE